MNMNQKNANGRSFDKSVNRAQNKHRDAAKYQQMEQLGRTVSCYLKAIRIKQNDPSVYYNLGNILQKKGELEPAVASYKRAIELDPGQVGIYHNLGVVLSKLGKFDEAIDCYKKAIKLEPDYALAYNSLGNVFEAQTSSEKAIVCYEKAIELKPDFAEAYNNMGCSLDGAGRTDEAIASFINALEIMPNLIDAGINLSSVFERLHRLDDARNVLVSVLQIDPNSYLGNYTLAQLEYRKGSYSAAKEILETLITNHPNHEHTSRTFYLLGKVFDKLNNYCAAFHAFKDSNELKSSSAMASVYRKRNIDDLNQIFNMRMWFSRAKISEWNNRPYANGLSAPIFLTGFPRSGTTLLGQILNAHPRIITLDEMPVLEKTFNEFIGSNENLRKLCLLSDDEIIGYREKYWKAVMSHTGSLGENSVVVDKMPLNIIYLGIIYRFFPDANIIVALRHPMAVAFSNFMQNFKLNLKMINFLTLEGTAKFYALVMESYLHYKKTFPLSIYQIRYEDIVRNFEKETRRLLNFLNLPWEGSLPRYYERARNGKITTPSYSQVTRPIYHQAVSRWENYKEQLIGINSELEPFVHAFQYSF